MFGEAMQAKVIGPKFSKKSGIPWQEAIWLGRDTEADEIIVATPEGEDHSSILTVIAAETRTIDDASSIALETACCRSGVN